jgi:hypothetical protein
MAAQAGLRQQALAAGAEDELDCTNFEVFAHGTTAAFAARLVETQGDCLSETGGKWAGKFFTVPDIRVAAIFAKRTSDNVRQANPTVVGVALAPAVVQGLRTRGLLTSPPIQNPPPGISATTPQFVFERGALETLKRNAFFFILR